MPAIHEIGQHIFPLLKPDDPDRPDVYGTAIFCSLGQHKLVVTAAHVLDQDDARTIYLPDGMVLEVEQTQVVSTSIPPSGKRDDDRIDVATFRLTDSQAEGLEKKGIRPIPAAYWNVDDRLMPKKKYVFSGFPASRSRVIFPRKVIQAKGISANCITAAPRDILAMGLHPTTHIVGQFDRENMMDDSGTRITAPEPWGMSGGAVWTQLPNSDDFVWVGVGIENRSDQKVLVGTRLEAITVLLRSFPELIPLLPRPQAPAFASAS